MTQEVDSTYQIIDADNTPVAFGDMLVGRLNYRLRFGNLVKIKINNVVSYAHCLDSCGEEIKFDLIQIDHNNKILKIDAYGASGLMAKQLDFKRNNNTDPLFENIKPVKTVRVKPTEDAFDYIVEKTIQTYIQNKNRGYGFWIISFKFIFNKNKYEITIHPPKIDWRQNKVCAELAYGMDKLNIEGVNFSTHPKIIKLLQDLDQML